MHESPPIDTLLHILLLRFIIALRSHLHVDYQDFRQKLLRHFNFPTRATCHILTFSFFLSNVYRSKY